LEDITVFPKSLDLSLKEKALVLKSWATYLSKHVDSCKVAINYTLKQHMNKLTSEYMNREDLSNNISNHTKRKREIVDDENNERRSLFQELQANKSTMRLILQDSKTHVIKIVARYKNKDLSQVSMSSGSSITVEKFGQRNIKNGQVMINLESTFIKKFPRIKVNVLRSAILNVGQGKQMQGYISHGVNVQSGVVIPLGHCEFIPEPLAKTNARDSSLGYYWYTSKEDAKCALMWYCLYSYANVKWRRKWLEFVLGDGNDEVQVYRTNFKKNDACFVLNRIEVDSM
jgi:hypothetical protein